MKSVVCSVASIACQPDVRWVEMLVAEKAGHLAACLAKSKDEKLDVLRAAKMDFLWDD